MVRLPYLWRPARRVPPGGGSAELRRTTATTAAGPCGANAMPLPACCIGIGSARVEQVQPVRGGGGLAT